MEHFLVTTGTPVGPKLSSALQQIGGRLLTTNTWIVIWGGTADTLCLKLRPLSISRVVVCSTTSDWSYR